MSGFEHGPVQVCRPQTADGGAGIRPEAKERRAQAVPADGSASAEQWLARSSRPAAAR